MTDGLAAPTFPAPKSAASSDWGSLRELYQAHATVVRLLLLRLGVREADVDDLLQDVFLVALRRHADFEGRSSARTWLCGITVRLAAAHRRRQRVRELFRLAPRAVDTSGPLRAVEKAEASQLVARILDRLSAPKRAVLVLYEVEQLSGEEIAEIVGCPLKTVWTRLFYARQAFTAELRKQGLLEDESAVLRTESQP
jgi:RNA polymerase sigma-70 factor, ECF subfamily